MIKTGDIVRFLNDVGGGKVTGYVSKTMVNVEIEGGFEIPYPVSQLIVTGNENKTEQRLSTPVNQKIKPEKPEIKVLNGKDLPNFLFVLVPVNENQPVKEGIELYLVNDSNYFLLFHFSLIDENGCKTVKYGMVNPNSKKMVGQIVENQFSNMPDFGFQLVCFKEKEPFLNEPIVKKFRINPLKFYKTSTYTQNPYFDKNALSLQVYNKMHDIETEKMTNEDLSRLIREKENEPKKEVEKKNKPLETVEIDLHIDQLIDSKTGLSNSEIIGIQLQKAENELKTAIANGTKRIVFIHGVGQGVLKQELTKLFKQKYPRYYFQDASFREYGYGATMVILKR